MTSRQQTRLRPSQGGQFAKPVVPARNDLERATLRENYHTDNYVKLTITEKGWEMLYRDSEVQAASLATRLAEAEAKLKDIAEIIGADPTKDIVEEVRGGVLAADIESSESLEKQLEDGFFADQGHLKGGGWVTARDIEQHRYGGITTTYKVEFYRGAAEDTSPSVPFKHLGAGDRFYYEGHEWKKVDVQEALILGLAEKVNAISTYGCKMFIQDTDRVVLK